MSTDRQELINDLNKINEKQAEIRDFFATFKPFGDRAIDREISDKFLEISELNLESKKLLVALIGELEAEK